MVGLCAEEITVAENLAVSKHSPSPTKSQAESQAHNGTNVNQKNRQLGSASKKQQVPARTLRLDVSLQAQLSHVPGFYGEVK